MGHNDRPIFPSDQKLQPSNADVVFDSIIINSRHLTPAPDAQPLWILFFRQRKDE